MLANHIHYFCLGCHDSGHGMGFIFSLRKGESMNEDYGIKEEYDRFYNKLKELYGQNDQEDKINREESVEADRQTSEDGPKTRQEDCRLWNEKDEEQIINRYNMVALTIIIICIIFCLVNALFN